MTSKELTKLAVAALEDRKAEDVTVIDISEISPIADYLKSMEGYPTGNWILMDYGDIIIHIFSKEDRLFYDLERTWRDGKVVDVSEL